MITIDTMNFTPFSAFSGGILIGIAVILFFISTGRLAGVSGIVNNTLTNTTNWLSNFLFLIGLILGPTAYMLILNKDIPFIITSSIPLIIIGGILVGLGTKIGSGCTSGHGICGISRFSIRSLVATITFILVAMITVVILKLLGFA
tara:strand:+ start:49 stop:486 length:438 start_codon:yes stop_codon:yes gene_type:complete